MVSANGGKHDNQNSDARELEKPRSDATSDETLSDLEETEKAASSAAGEGKTSPTPDGEFDQRRDESDDAGPM